MSTTTLDATTASERLLRDGVAFKEFLSAHLGMRLGLYTAMAGGGPMTATELADRAGIDARYAREWLEQQTAAGYLACDDPGAAAEERRFTLPDGLATALLDPTSEDYIGPLAGMAGGIAAVVRELATAYRTGGGVSYEAYGSEVREGLATLNGASYDGEIADWIATMPRTRDRLNNGDAPSILDLGCGTGRSALALAGAFPRASVHGVDLDKASVADARAAAADAGVADRVTFSHGDAATVAGRGYDLVTVFEALHDMGDPVGALRAARDAVVDDGAVYVVDERVADEFTPDADIVERLQYGFSVLHCLPATMAEDPVVAHGTVLRQPTLTSWAREAGFAEVEELDIEDPFWRHYQLVPVSRA